MECPHCRSDIDNSFIDITEVDEGCGIGLYFYAPCCKKSFCATVEPGDFEECD